MKITRYLILAFLMTACVQGIELQKLDHEVIHDQRTYSRDATDCRYSVWTDEQDKATKLLKDFGFAVQDFQLQKGQILAIFLNDNITQDLTQIVYNKTANMTFADYADSGIMFKLRAPEEGKKYSHVTVVIFKPTGTPGHLGVRDMVRGGLSDKQ